MPESKENLEQKILKAAKDLVDLLGTEPFDKHSPLYKGPPSEHQLGLRYDALRGAVTRLTLFEGTSGRPLLVKLGEFVVKRQAKE